MAIMEVRRKHKARDPRVTSEIPAVQLVVDESEQLVFGKGIKPRDLRDEILGLGWDEFRRNDRCVLSTEMKFTGQNVPLLQYFYQKS